MAARSNDAMESGGGRGMTGSAQVDPQAVGEEFIAALANRDSRRLEDCFRPDAHLRALVPRGPQDHVGAATLAATFKKWFGDADTLQILEKSSVRIGGRLHLRYRFREGYSDGDSEVIEQNAFCDVEDGRIRAMDLVCSGHLPEPKPASTGPYHFDAGELGCGSGLPQEFRRQIAALPVGSQLEILARDPAAKEDLPSLARLLGHRVVSVRNAPDGSTVVLVERGG
jgi:TusA-related sulfurtransferase